MSEEQSNKSWDQYSRLVLKELETLTQGIANLQKELERVFFSLSEFEFLKIHQMN